MVQTNDDLQGLTINFEKIEENICILHLSGYIDTYNSAAFRKQILSSLEKGFNKMIFDCGGITYISSTGIGVFTDTLKVTMRKGGNLVIYNILPKVFEVFHLLGFSQFFNIAIDRDDAIQMLKKPKLIEEKISVCPFCNQKLKIKTSGRFRCPKCKTTLIVKANGEILIG